jgi:KUP system potassium uptake protein
MTRQAMQLGWFPGVRIRQTSDEEYGQIYVPFVNWAMMAFTVALTVGFANSDRLAGAYGTAVSTTMLFTTALLYRVMRDRWGWWAPAALAVGGTVMLVDFTLFAANLAKIRDGGWIPLAFGALVFATMATWRYGKDALQTRHAAASMSSEAFFAKLRKLNITRIPGTAVFLTRMADTAPLLLVRQVEQIGALQESVVALTVKFADVPRIPRAERLDVRKLAENFWQITAHFGFVQVPDLPAALRQARASGCEIDIEHAIFFNARDAVVAKPAHNLAARARLLLFAFMLRNAVRAVDLFRIPTDNFIEMGRTVEI